ncbi:MAG: hypothetical protein ACR2L2_18955 [Acidobacteriota bacterium]
MKKDPEISLPASTGANTLLGYFYFADALETKEQLNPISLWFTGCYVDYRAQRIGNVLTERDPLNRQTSQIDLHHCPYLQHVNQPR